MPSVVRGCLGVNYIEQNTHPQSHALVCHTLLQTTAHNALGPSWYLQQLGNAAVNYILQYWWKTILFKAESQPTNI